MSNLQNSDQEIGYYKGKCEVYERIVPELTGSLVQMIAVHMHKQLQPQPPENLMGRLFGDLFSIPQFQEHMKHIMDQERARFDKEHPI